jgi:hypothetical protein
VLNTFLDEIIYNFRLNGRFTAVTVELSDSEIELWVNVKIDPNRFTPLMFEGHWANPKVKPGSGPMKLLKVQSDNEGFFRIIARQDKKIFAYPWL